MLVKCRTRFYYTFAFFHTHVFWYLILKQYSKWVTKNTPISFTLSRRRKRLYRPGETFLHVLTISFYDSRAAYLVSSHSSHTLYFYPCYLLVWETLSKKAASNRGFVKISWTSQSSVIPKPRPVPGAWREGATISGHLFCLTLCTGKRYLIDISTC